MCRTCLQEAGKRATLNAVSRACEGDIRTAQITQSETIPTFSVRSTTDYHLQGDINGISAKFLVDTGAATTLVSKDVWDKVATENEIELNQIPGNPPRLVGVQGSPLQIHGTAQLQVNLSKEKFNAQILVADSLTTDVILGLDFLNQYKCVIDTGKQLIHFADRGVTMSLNCPPGGQQIAHVSVILDSNLNIPPCSELETIAKVPESANSSTWILESNPTGRNAVLVARTLVKPVQREVPIRLLNSRNDQITVKKGTVVAQMEPLTEDVSSSVAVVRERHPEDIPEEKREMLWEIVERDGDHLGSQEKEKLFQLLQEYEDIFASTPEDFGRTGMIKHKINTGEAQPIRQQVRRIPLFRREEARKLLHSMLEKDVIQPSKSPWASPIVLVRKKDGSTRFCVDYRKVNAVTRKDAYPIPRVDDTLDTLAGAQWFSTLDLISGYWQVEVNEEDREKTAFCTPDGLYEFKVMPFGLCNAPATFQRLMDLVLAGLQWSTCLVYLDDVVIAGKTFKEHISRLRAVFQRLREAGLRLQPAKCSLCQKKVDFLGHTVSEKGVATDHSKTDKVANWPIPTSQKEVQQFLGLANYYRRFVKDFATIAKPLHHLTEKTAEFKWTEQCQKAFEEIRHRLVSSPILAFPDFSKPFILDTDASDVGIGAVLSQEQEDGTERVLAYASRVLSKPERRYCVTRKELLAVVSFIKHFRPYLLGRHFTLRTDHGSLTWLWNFRDPEGQLARWIEKLQEYDFTIVHRSGRKHGNADALSRLPCKQCGRDSHAEETSIGAVTKTRRSPLLGKSSQDIRRFQLDDPTVKFVLIAKEKDEKPDPSILKGQSLQVRRLIQLWNRLEVKDGVLWRRFDDDQSKANWMQLIVPKSLKEEIMEELHAGVVGGHLGEEKTIHQLKRRFYWPGYSQDVRNWCRTCANCATRKTQAPKQKAPMQTIKSGYPMQVIAVDIMGPLPESDGRNSYILVVGDYFSKWMEAFPIPDQEATTVAQKLVDEIFCRFSAPEQLHSDQGKQFESALIKEICNILNISKSRTTAYHPQCDGLVERFNRTLQNMVSTTVKDHPFDWEEAIRKVCMAYNTTVHASTGYSPFYLMFGREARLPIDLVYGTQTQQASPVQEYAQNLKKLLEDAYDKVREKSATAHKRQKEIYDRKVHGEPYKVNDKVWLFNPVVKKGKSRKLHHPWIGPYIVIERVSECDYRLKAIQGKKNLIIVHFNRLKLCSPGTRFSRDKEERIKVSPQVTCESNTHLPTKDVGEELVLLDDDEATYRDPPQERRYPSRSRNPPDRL